MKWIWKPLHKLVILILTKILISVAGWFKIIVTQLFNRVKIIEKWFKNLKYVSFIENYVMVYWCKSCHWGEQRLRNNKSNYGHRLHKVNNIIDDEVGQIPHTSYTMKQTLPFVLTSQSRNFQVSIKNDGLQIYAHNKHDPHLGWNGISVYLQDLWQSNLFPLSYLTT